MKIYTKSELIQDLKKIKAMGWIENRRHGNQGGAGNTLEELLGIEENNLPLPNATEWELKTLKTNQTSLATQFHMEPSPRAIKFVPNVLLPKYGWQHNKAGDRYPETEMSFRQTINGLNRTDRGFGIQVDRKCRRILISFDATAVNQRHKEWLISVDKRVGLSELDPQPYWGFDDLFYHAGTKLKNCFYVKADVKRKDNKEWYHYRYISMLENISVNKLIDAIENGTLLIDFDARTGHNHGTKFRMRRDKVSYLYEKETIIEQ